MRVDPKAPRAPDRDRLILSKGHASGALYATLAEAGFIPVEALQTYMKPLSMLNGHPNRNYVPGVEANTGPLGHGLPIAVGVALAGKIDRAVYRVFVITGDGELQEGSNWEAAMAAGHHKLANLTLIIDATRFSRAHGSPRPTTSSRSPTSSAPFGGTSSTSTATTRRRCSTRSRRAPIATKPLCVIAHTVKGKGVSYMEDQVGWHHGVPTQAQLDQAMEELSHS